MSTLDRIDATLANLCACGCGASLDHSPSAWYATEDCQRRHLSVKATDAYEVYARPDAGAVEVWRGRILDLFDIPPYILDSPTSPSFDTVETFIGRMMPEVVLTPWQRRVLCWCLRRR